MGKQGKSGTKNSHGVEIVLKDSENVQVMHSNRFEVIGSLEDGGQLQTVKC